MSDSEADISLDEEHVEFYSTDSELELDVVEGAVEEIREHVNNIEEALRPNYMPEADGMKDLDVQLNFDIPVEYISCSICGSILTQPCTLLCQHTFCYDCLLKLVQSRVKRGRRSGPNVHRCPICREHFILPKKEKFNVILEDIIQKLIPEEMIPKRQKVIKKRTLEDEVRAEIRQEILQVLMFQSSEAGLIPDLEYDRNEERMPLRNLRVPFGPQGRNNVLNQARRRNPRYINPPNPPNPQNPQNPPIEMNRNSALVQEATRIGMELNRHLTSKKFKVIFLIVTILFGSIGIYCLFTLIRALVGLVL